MVQVECKQERANNLAVGLPDLDFRTKTVVTVQVSAKIWQSLIEVEV